MKYGTRLLSVLLCAIICLSLITTVSAAATPIIKITSSEAKVGDTVTIDLEITDNPGIMAMAFCITYDNKVLEYIEDSCKSDSSYTKTALTVKNHTDKGHVAVVFVENKDNTKSGKILSLKFVVKNDIAGKHVISLANSNREKHGTKLHNSFSNSTQDYIIPRVISGGITIAETCENSGHKYGEWNILKEATCTQTGLKEHTCIRCNFTEEETIAITHDFETEWTVDKAATPTEDGIMSRHCKQCDQVTDIITFSYEEIDDDNESDNDNTSSNESGNNSFDASNDTESNESNTDTSSNSSSNQKPNIDNVVGEKVPLDEAEKFDDYKPEYSAKPDSTSPNSSDLETSVQDTSSDFITDSSDLTTGAIENTISSTPNEDSSFLNSSSGIIVTVICALISIGIIALGVLLIIKNKKQ